jgi:hypothetical protein
MKNETCMQVDSPYSDQVEWAVAPVTTTVATATVATAITAVEEAAARLAILRIAYPLK